jgi:hypothetical protein
MMSTRFKRSASSAAAAFIAATILAAGAVAPAYADPTGNESAKASAQQEEKQVAKEPRYCLKPQVTTGTILSRKTCMTREQWIAKTGVDPAVQK